MFISFNNKTITRRHLFYCFLFFNITCLSAQKKDSRNYTRFIDSANYYVNESRVKTQLFLDSIPQPFEQTIKGRLGDYYNIKALSIDTDGDLAQVYQNYILALKYAQKEKNYRVAGTASLELFASIYFAKKDTLAFKYLKKAEKYYRLDNHTLGLIEVDQMYAYAKFVDSEYEACNSLILKHLDTYKNTKEDAYFYMFAMYMLTVNYIELGDFKNAYSSFKELKTLKDNSTIVKFNYFQFEATINLALAEVYLNKKALDSTQFYLAKSSKLRNYMTESSIKTYFSLNTEYYKHNDDTDQSQMYIDSLKIFEKKIFNNMVAASLQLNTPLMQVESELEEERNKKYWNGVLAACLFILLSAISVFYVFYYKRQKYKLDDFQDIASNFSYLKFTNEKLTGKVRGLEDYISNLKKEIKDISTIHEMSLQRERIKELYKAVHINSSTLLDKSESHLELVNDLNIEFFYRIHLKYPELNDSEVITCYYLFMGFKNKEIAMFLNTSVRALESKRYRISKKIDYDYNKETTTLVKHLKKTFKSSKVKED